MMFILGIICGILLVLALIIIETYLDIKKKKIVETIKEVVVDMSKQKGIIIPAQTEKELARDNLVRYNNERGIDTSLDQLDL